MPGGAAPKSSTGTATQPDQIEKLLDTPGSKVYGAVQRAGWSSEKLNVALLGVADGNARLNVEKIHFKNVMIGQSAVDGGGQEPRDASDVRRRPALRGAWQGRRHRRRSAGNANIGANINLDSVSALPFLKDAANFEWVAGKANVGLRLTANGASQLQLIESLNGNADFQFANGAIVGFNCRALSAGYRTATSPVLRKSPSEKTNFSALGASFTIANGVAQNQDLQLVSPMLRVTGAGIIHMPERTVDYTVKPKSSPRSKASKARTPHPASKSGAELPAPGITRATGRTSRRAFRSGQDGRDDQRDRQEVQRQESRRDRR